MSLSTAYIPRNFGHNTRLNILDLNFHHRASGIILRSPVLVVKILKGFRELLGFLVISAMNIRPLPVQNGKYWIDRGIIAVSPNTEQLSVLVIYDIHI
jgi:hypothetical protein